MHHSKPFQVCISLTLCLFIANSLDHIAATEMVAFQNGDDNQELTEIIARLEAMEAESKSLSDVLGNLEIDSKSRAAPSIKFPNVNISGVFQADAVTFNQDDGGREAHGLVEGGADFRRARLGAKGSVSDRMDYFMQMDFAFFGRPTFTDLWVDFQDVGSLGTVRVGQWKQPFSLEVVSSFRYTTFLERAGIFQAFTPFRHLGIGFYDYSNDLNATWAASYFRTGQDQFAGSLSTNGGNGLASRVTRLLWYDGVDGENYMHLGFGYFLNAPPNKRARFRTIPEIYVGEFVVPSGEPIGTSGQAVPNVANGTPFFVDTGVLNGTRLTQSFGAESLWVRGPVSWQSEAIGTIVDTSTVGDVFLYGAYTQIGYFLTGEHRPYDRKAGAIDRVIPFQSLSKECRGYGAWEIAARLSYVDLTDNLVQGGDMENLTLGLNWYVNPNCKCVFNYIHSWTNSRQARNGSLLGSQLIASQTDAWGLRVQLDF